MNCPNCGHGEHHVKRTTPKDGSIRRLRTCDRCGHPWPTLEVPEEQLAADREKLARGRELALRLLDQHEEAARLARKEPVVP